MQSFDKFYALDLKLEIKLFKPLRLTYVLTDILTNHNP